MAMKFAFFLSTPRRYNYMRDEYYFNLSTGIVIHRHAVAISILGFELVIRFIKSVSW